MVSLMLYPCMYLTVFFIITGTLGPCATVVAFGFLRCHHVIHAVVMLICAYAFTGFAYSGFLTNHLDLAPRYAGITLGLSNTLGMIAQQAAPVLSTSIIVDVSWGHSNV